MLTPGSVASRSRLSAGKNARFPGDLARHDTATNRDQGSRDEKALFDNGSTSEDDLSYSLITSADSDRFAMVHTQGRREDGSCKGHPRKGHPEVEM
jgi:hypothetical protein